MTDLDMTTEFEDAMQPADFFEDDGMSADEAREPWKPTDENGVDWALLKRGNAQKRMAKLLTAKAEALHELSQLYDRRIASEQRTFDFFDATAKEAIALAEPDKKGNRKLALPHGTVYTTHRDEFSWPDDEELVAWAHAHLPEAVRVKESPDKTLLKAHVKETGELPDGLTVERVESVQIREA